MKIKPIKTGKDLKNALKRVKELWNAKPNTPQADELEILTILIEIYENKINPFFRLIKDAPKKESLSFNHDLSEEQMEKFNKWISKKKKIETGAIGGRYTFCFTPTGLGSIIKVIDNIKHDEIDLTDVGSW